MATNEALCEWKKATVGDSETPDEWMRHRWRDERAPSLIEQQRLSAKLQTPIKFKLCKQTSAKLRAATLTTTMTPTISTDVGWYFTRESPVVLPRVACAYLPLNFQGWPCRIDGHAWMKGSVSNLLPHLDLSPITSNMRRNSKFRSTFPEWISSIKRTFEPPVAPPRVVMRELCWRNSDEESNWLNDWMNRVGRNCGWPNESSWLKLWMNEWIELIENES